MATRIRPAITTLLATGLVLACCASAPARGPVPLRGSPLAAKTHLRLVVSDSPPFVLDVDRGSVTRLRGVRATKKLGFTVMPVSAQVAVVITLWARSPNKLLYAVRNGGAVVTPLGSGRDVAPTADGTGIWVTRVASKGHCTLRRIGFDGRNSAARALPCDALIAPGGSLGLVVHRSRVIDPLTLRTIIASRRGVLAVAGDRLLLTGLGPTDAPNETLALLDGSTRSEQTVRIPNTIGSLGSTTAVDPRGRYIAVELGNPSWNLTGMQVLDVWVIDTETGVVGRLPGMPAFVSLKRTNMAWTGDGRLVLLGEADDGAFVAVWRPGQRTLPLKLVHLPEREGSSDAFAPLG